MKCARDYAGKWMINAYANFHGDLKYYEEKYDEIIEIAGLMPLRSIYEDPYPDLEEKNHFCKDCNAEYLANNDWPYEICMNCALKRIRKENGFADDEIVPLYRKSKKCDFAPPLMNCFQGIKLDIIKDSNVKIEDITDDFKQREQGAGD